MFDPINFVRPASRAHQWLVRALSGAAVFAVALAAQDPAWLLGFAGIFGGELVRFATLAIRAARRLGARAADLTMRRSAAHGAALEYQLVLSSGQLVLQGAAHSVAASIPSKFAAALAARLHAAIGGIAHLALTCRLLPAPFSAR